MGSELAVHGPHYYASPLRDASSVAPTDNAGEEKQDEWMARISENMGATLLPGSVEGWPAGAATF